MRSPVMTSDGGLPVDFASPTSLVANQFTSSHWGRSAIRRTMPPGCRSSSNIRTTPGYPDGNWPPHRGMTLEENLSELRRHADDFTNGAGYTFTDLDTGDRDVIGCVYLYPSAPEEWEVTAQSWVRADRSSLDVPLAAAARWLATDWLWERVDPCGR